MFVGVFIECVAWSFWWTWCVLLIIWIPYCWSFVRLVSCRSFSFILFLFVNINALKNVFDSKGWSNSKQFSFFVFYFNLSNISSTPPRLLNLYEFDTMAAKSRSLIVFFKNFQYHYHSVSQSIKNVIIRYIITLCNYENSNVMNCLTLDWAFKL